MEDNAKESTQGPRTIIGFRHLLCSSSWMTRRDDANHIHSVWCEVNHDLGQNLLQQHYETSH